MAKLLERDVVGKHEDLSDVLTNLDRRKTSFCSNLSEGPAPQNTLMEWPVDDYPSVQLGGAPEERDRESFENFDNRALCQNYIQIWERAPSVGRLAQRVANAAGVGKKKLMAKQITKGLVMEKRDIEATFLSNQECARQTAAAGSDGDTFLTRGFLQWTRTENPVDGVLPIPNDYLPGEDQVVTVAEANFSDDHVADVMEAVWDHTGDAGNFFGLCGTKIKKAISNLTDFIQAGNVTVNVDRDDNRLSRVVDILDTDFGIIELEMSPFLDVSTVPSEADPSVPKEDSQGRKVYKGNKWVLYVLDLNMWQSSWEQKPHFRPFEDKGAGPRGLIEAIGGLRCLNPLGSARIEVTPT